MDIEWDKALFSSERFEYHPPSLSRDHIFHAMFNNKEAVLPQLPFFYGMSEEAHTERREKQKSGILEGTSCYLDVIDKHTATVVGGAGFREIEGTKAEWGIIVEPSWRKKGVASEAFFSNVKFAKEKLKCTHILAATLPINDVMLAFLHKRGMRELKRVDGDEWIRFEAEIEDLL